MYKDRADYVNQVERYNHWMAVLEEIVGRPEALKLEKEWMRESEQGFTELADRAEAYITDIRSW